MDGKANYHVFTEHPLCDLHVLGVGVGGQRGVVVVTKGIKDTPLALQPWN